MEFIYFLFRTPLSKGMGEGCYTQPYPCICKEAVFGFEPMTNKSPRHNFTATPGLALTYGWNIYIYIYIYLLVKLNNHTRDYLLKHSTNSTAAFLNKVKKDKVIQNI